MVNLYKLCFHWLSTSHLELKLKLENIKRAMGGSQEMWWAGAAEVGQCDETYACEACFLFAISPAVFQPLLLFFCERTGGQGRYAMDFLHVLKSLVGLVLCVFTHSLQILMAQWFSLRKSGLAFAYYLILDSAILKREAKYRSNYALPFLSPQCCSRGSSRGRWRQRGAPFQPRGRSHLHQEELQASWW